jgi:hypothetical protein
MRFRIERGVGVWKVVGTGVHIEARELAWAVFDAITLAEFHGGAVELDEGVPMQELDSALQQQLEPFTRSRE